MHKYVSEFIGTFFLVFTVCAVSLNGAPLGVIAIGSALMVMIYAGGHISGAHFNPAVTLGVLIRGRITAAEAMPYWITQLVAGVVGALLANFVIDPEQKAPALDISGSHLIVAALLAEFLFTFALVYVVLNVATSKDHPVNSFYGLAIGFTVLTGAIAVGGVSGGAFNPAVAVGIMSAGISAWHNAWIYLLADLLGAVVAAFAFKATNPEDA